MAHFARRPTPEETAAAMAAGPGSPEVALNRLRVLYSQERNMSLAAAERICNLVQNGGRAEIEAVLGAEAADLVTIYEALKAFILAIDATAVVPDLPE